MTPGFDEDVLGDPQLIAQRDPSAVLLELAGAGAAVRRAVAVAPEWITGDLRAAGPPRAVLVAHDTLGSLVGDVLDAVVGPFAPLQRWERDEPPRWAGPGDALLVASTDGWSPRLARLVELSSRRGLAIAVAAPEQTPLEAAARHGRAALAAVPARRSARGAPWTVLAPLLQAADALGAAAVPPALLTQIADALDEVAAACSPSADAVTNPAKLLALELGESRAVLAGSGPLGAAGARRMAALLALMAGEPASVAILPGEAGAAAGLLTDSDADAAGGGDDPDGLDALFRDRVDDPRLPPRLLIFADPESGDSADSPGSPDAPGDRAAAELAGIARSLSARASVVAGAGPAPLARFAAAGALADFACAYLSLVRGVDPGAPRSGEAPDYYGADDRVGARGRS